MRTLLVLAEHPDLAEAIRAALNAESFRVLHRSGLEEAEPLLAHGLIDNSVYVQDLTYIFVLLLVLVVYLPNTRAIDEPLI